jgi:hypothetical protein
MSRLPMLCDGVLPRRHVRLDDVVKVPKRAVRIETPDHERGTPRQVKEKTVERTEESELPQRRGESLVAQLDSALNQAEQLRDQQIQQQYSDQLGVYVQEKAEQIDRLQSSLAAALSRTSVTNTGFGGTAALGMSTKQIAEFNEGVKAIAEEWGISEAYLRAVAVAGHSTESTWLDRRQKKCTLNGSSRWRDERPGSRRSRCA